MISSELTDLAKTIPIQALCLPNWASLYWANLQAKGFLPRRSSNFESLKTGLKFGKIAQSVSFLFLLDYIQLINVYLDRSLPSFRICVESGMQIKTLPSQINARHLNVPHVLYSGGRTIVSIWRIFTDLIFRVFETAVGTSSENNSPKSFNSWAVIDFVTDKLDVDQIRDRAWMLSSCCQQIGRYFLWMQHKVIC